MTLLFSPLLQLPRQYENAIGTPSGSTSAASQPRHTPPQAPLHRICTSPLVLCLSLVPHSPLALSQLFALVPIVDLRH